MFQFSIESPVWVCIVKGFMAVINHVAQKDTVFVKASKKWLTIMKTIAYYPMAFIVAVKSLMIQAQGGVKNWNKFTHSFSKLDLFTSLKKIVYNYGMV
jgi:hypothetical protein